MSVDMSNSAHCREMQQAYLTNPNNLVYDRLKFQMFEMFEMFEKLEGDLLGFLDFLCRLVRLATRCSPLVVAAMATMQTAKKTAGDAVPIDEV